MVIHNHFQREMSGAFAAQTAFLRLAHAGGVKSVNLCELSVPGTEARCRPSHYRLSDDPQLRTGARKNCTIYDAALTWACPPPDVGLPAARAPAPTMPSQTKAPRRHHLQDHARWAPEL